MLFSTNNSHQNIITLLFYNLIRVKWLNSKASILKWQSAWDFQYYYQKRNTKKSGCGWTWCHDVTMTRILTLSDWHSIPRSVPSIAMNSLVPSHNWLNLILNEILNSEEIRKEFLQQICARVQSPGDRVGYFQQVFQFFVRGINSCKM